MIESLLRLVIDWCGRFTAANVLLLPTADVFVAFLWFRMRPVYRLVRVGLGADAEAYSAEYNRWWTNGGAPETREFLDRKNGR